MKIRSYIISLLLFVSAIVTGQSEWEVFANINYVRDIETHDNFVYVANTNGLLIIDQESGEEQFITTAGTGLHGSDFYEIEMLDNGHFWIYNSHKFYYGDGNTIEQKLDSISGGDIVVTQNKLWFTGRDSRIEDAPLQLYSFSDGILQTHEDHFPEGVKNTFVDINDQLWIQVDNYIAKYDGLEVTNQLAITSLTGTRKISEYYVDKNLNHWVSIYDAAGKYFISRYSNFSWTTFELGGALYFEDFFENDSDDIVFTLRDQIGRINGGQVTIDSIYHLFPELGDGWVSKNYWAILHHIENDTVMWLSYRDFIAPAKIYRISPSGTTEYGHQNNFPIAFPQGLAKDCNGTIYCSGNYTSTKYLDSEWSDLPLDILDKDCYSFYLTPDPSTCTMWAYGSSGDCQSMWNLSLDEPRDIDILPDDDCTQVEFDQEGNMYALCKGQLYKTNEVGNSEQFNSQVAPQQTYVFTIGDSGELWAIGSSPLFDFKLFKLEDNEWESTNPIDFGYPRFIFEDAAGHIWTNSENGLSSYDGNSWTEHVLGDYFIREIVEDSHNNFWMASNSGLLFWDKEELTIYNITNSDIPSNHPRDLTIVDDHLWMRNVGIAKMKIDNLDTATKKPNSNPLSYTLYPNPSAGHITIANPSHEKLQIDIFTMSGALVSSQVSNAVEYSIDLEAGAYWVRLSGASGMAVEKVFVF